MDVTRILSSIYKNSCYPSITKAAGDLICFFQKNVLVPLEENKKNLNAFVKERLKQCMTTLISFHGNALQFATEELQSDEKVVRIAVAQNIQSLRYAHKNLKRNESFMNSIFAEREIHTFEGKISALGISREDRLFIDSLKENNKSNLISIALHLSFGEGIIKELKYAKPEVKNNKEFMLAAAEIDIQALEHASVDLKNDPKFILAAAKKGYTASWAFDISAVKYASEELKNNSIFMLDVSQKNIRALEYASGELKNDSNFMLDASKNGIRALEYAGRELKKDEKFMLAATQINIQALEFADKTLKQNREFMLAAARIDIKALRYADKTLQQDEEFLLPIHQENGITSLEKWTEILGYRDPRDFFRLNKNNKSLIKQALNFTFTPKAIKEFGQISNDLKTDEDFMLTAAKNNIELLQHSSHDLKNSKDFMRIAAKQNIGALQYASKELKQDERFVQSVFEENGVISFEAQIKALGFDPQGKWLLFDLVAIKNHILIKQALELSLSTETRDRNGLRALDLAILQKDTQTLQIFVDHFKQSGGTCYEYLQRAARIGWETGVKMLFPFFDLPALLKAQTSLNCPTTLLHDAVYSGNLSLVKFLVKCGFDINKSTYGKKEYSHSVTEDEGYNTEYSYPVYKYTYAEMSPLAVARVFHPQDRNLKDYLTINGGKDFLSWSISTSKIKEMFKKAFTN